MVPRAVVTGIVMGPGVCEYGGQGGTEMVETAEMAEIDYYSKTCQISGLRPPQLPKNSAE